MSLPRILIVDDEPSVVETLSAYLTCRGYDVDTFSSAEDVLSCPERQLRNYDIVLTDFEMPGLNGVELAKRLLDFHPSIQVIVMSGKVELVATGATEIGSILRKPFHMRDLDELVQLDREQVSNPVGIRQAG